ncbi:MAG: hypothetical protein ABIJ86_11400 [Spirochaetota bacterium]
MTDRYNNDMFEAFDEFKRMEKYYNAYCVVRHWKQHAFVETRMRIRDAVWQMKEGWLERASFTPEE